MKPDSMKLPLTLATLEDTTSDTLGRAFELREDVARLQAGLYQEPYHPRRCRPPQYKVQSRKPRLETIRRAFGCALPTEQSLLVHPDLVVVAGAADESP